MQEEGINTYESCRDLLTALMKEFIEHESFYSPFMPEGWQIQLVNYCVRGAFNSAIGDLIIYGLSNLTSLPCKVVTEGCNKVPYIHVVTPNRLNKTDVHDGGLLLILTNLHYEPLVKMEQRQSNEEKGEVFGCRRQEVHQNNNNDVEEVHQNNNNDVEEVHQNNNNDVEEVHQNNNNDVEEVHQNNNNFVEEVHQNNNNDVEEVHQNNNNDVEEVHQNNESIIHEEHLKNQNIIYEDPGKVLEVKLTECDEKLNEDVGEPVKSEPVAEIKMRKSIMIKRRLWSALRSKFRRNTNKTEKIRSEIKPSWIRRCLPSVSCCFGSKTNPE